MSKEKTAIEKIKTLLFGEETPIKDEVVAQKFMDANLEDGTLIQIEPALELEAAVVIIKEDGEVLQAPNETHTLADGTKIVTVEGRIKEIIPIAEEEEVIEDEVVIEAAAEVPQAEKVKKVIESIIKESHFASQEDITSVKSEIAKIKEELKAEVMASVFEAFKAFADEPATTPVVKSKENIFKKEPKKSWVDNFKK